MRQLFRLDFVWAALCLVGAVYVMFRADPFRTQNGPWAIGGLVQRLGALTRDEWIIWGDGHTDHHLRQVAR